MQMRSLFPKQWKDVGNFNTIVGGVMIRKRKLRRTYDQSLIELMNRTKQDWLKHQQLMNVSYQNDDLTYLTLMKKAKYFFLFDEAKRRKVSLLK